MRKPELLIPAGNLEKLRTAILYGADAVYTGVEGLSLRTGSAEMTIEALAQSVNEAHVKGVKIYAAVNTFSRNADLDQAKKIIPQLATIGIDAVIVSEPGMLRLIKSLAPQLPVHLSTQANTTNVEAVRFWQDQGVRRIILARELNLKEVGEIAEAVPEMELEIFVHGAMCMAYSGRCYLSAFRNKRSANEGDCSQPCRWEYLLHESTRPNDPLILEDDERYTYLLSSKDLCLIEYLPDVLTSGVTSLKVEGRMKSAYYVAVVTRTYRQALDALLRQKEKYTCRQEWIDELTKISNRGYTTGFAFAGEKINETNPEIKYIQTHEPSGIVINYDAAKKRVLLDVKNRIKIGDRLDILLPEEIVPIEINSMIDRNGNNISEAHGSSEIYLSCEHEIPAGALARQETKNQS
ncbi:peptidase, u32 family large subunit [hydrocarbon metagenome]|uniref:Peptidase, u32 family large subunit n=1 Tax=hydrocarbon metagenome TaxID=938273 RepID=A0A0W8FSG1_9ZZZZ